MSVYQLGVTVRSPLHIGAGGPTLRRNVDFATFGRFLYILDLDAVLDYILPDASDTARIDEVMRSQNLASFLTQADLQSHPRLSLYRLGGTSAVSEVRPQIKDVFARPYIPGSTLKGAIRTAITTVLASRQEVSIPLDQLGPRREWAGRGMEQRLVSRAPQPRQAPNYDILRTIQVADSSPVAGDALELNNVAVWPAGEQGIPIDIESIKPGTTFAMRLKLDDVLLGPYARQLEFGRGVEVIRRWLEVCQQHGIEQIQREAQFFAGRAAQVEQFYTSLLREAEQRVPNTFFTQLGWGAGWTAKTLSRVIQPNAALLAEIIQRYQLSRGIYRPGMLFPKTRRVVADRGQPLLPLGWVQVEVRT